MWNKFKNWHTKTWNEGNIGKGKIIGGWFIVLMILSSVGDGNKISSKSQISLANNVEKLKQECEELHLTYSKSNMMLEKYVRKFNEKIDGKTYELKKKVIFNKVWEYNGNYYASVNFLSELEKFDLEQKNKNIPKGIKELIKKAAIKHGNQAYTLQLKKNDNLIIKIEELIKNRTAVYVKLKGKASSQVCEIIDGQTVFNDVKLLRKEILRNGYIVDGYENIELLEIVK